MSHAAPGSTVQLERSHTKNDGESPLNFRAAAEYVHPFKLIPEVTQPQFDTRFRSLHDQRVTRMNALFTLAAITLLEDGAPSHATDEWLTEMRQNIRDLDGKVAATEEGRISVLGLTGMYLSSDASLRETDEMDIYRYRVKRCEANAEVSRMSTSPYYAAHLDIRHIMEEMAKNPIPEAATEAVANTLHFDPRSPEFTFSKAKALFDYACTMQPGAHKQALLLEAMAYADETFTSAPGDDHFLRGSALHVLARTLHDASEIPHSFSPLLQRDVQLAKQARNLSVALLQHSTREFQATNIDQGMIPRSPIDTSIPWAPQVTERRDYNDARYFQEKYHNEVRDKGIYMPKTPEIQRFVAKQTAIRFGHEIVILTEDETAHEQQVRRASVA